MKNGVVITYRIWGALVSLYAYMMLFVGIAGLFTGVPGPTLILTFIGVCLVIYSVLSSIFGRLVLLMKQPMRYSLKDWIKVNAYVGTFVYVVCLLAVVACLSYPGLMETVLKQHPEFLQQPGVNITKTQFLSMFRNGLFLGLAICILVSGHCIWTLVLVRRFKAFFK